MAYAVDLKSTARKSMRVRPPPGPPHIPVPFARERVKSTPPVRARPSLQLRVRTPCLHSAPSTSGNRSVRRSCSRTPRSRSRAGSGWALIGANGAGKSTLAKILAGARRPTAERSSVRRGLSIRYVGAGAGARSRSKSAREVVEDALTAWRAATTRHAEVSALLGETAARRGRSTTPRLAEQAALDDTIMHLGGWDRGHEALGFLHELGVRDVDRPCGARSGGERRRIALAQLLVASPDIAILDEPTNHLDADTAEWLEGYLAQDVPGGARPRDARPVLPRRDCPADRRARAGAAHVVRRGATPTTSRRRRSCSRTRSAPSRTGRTSCGASASGSRAGPKARTHQAEGAHPARARARGAGVGDRRAAGRGVARRRRRRRARGRRSSSSTACRWGSRGARR